MMKRETIPIADVCVPIKRRATLEQKRVDELAASMAAARGNFNHPKRVRRRNRSAPRISWRPAKMIGSSTC